MVRFASAPITCANAPGGWRCCNEACSTVACTHRRVRLAHLGCRLDHPAAEVPDTTTLIRLSHAKVGMCVRAQMALCGCPLRKRGRWNERVLASGCAFRVGDSKGPARRRNSERNLSTETSLMAE